MSYEIIKSIKVDLESKKVFINGASNNLRPLSFEVWECTSLSKLLQEKGEDALNVEILKTYESGDFQRGSNKYTKALKVLRFVLYEEYKKFNWRNHNATWGTEEHKQERALRESEEFKQLLLKAFKTKLPKEKYLVYRLNSFNGKEYVKKQTSRHIFFTRGSDEAMAFDFEKEAKDLADKQGYLYEVSNE